MTTTFPMLRTGAVAQYASSRQITVSTRVATFVDGSEQRFRSFPTPILRWTIRLDRLTADELDQLHAFFQSQNGSVGSFSFTDPWDGITHPDCSFELDTFASVMRDDTRELTTLVIRNNQA